MELEGACAPSGQLFLPHLGQSCMSGKSHNLPASTSSFGQRKEKKCVVSGPGTLHFFSRDHASMERNMLTSTHVRESYLIVLRGRMAHLLPEGSLSWEYRKFYNFRAGRNTRELPSMAGLKRKSRDSLEPKMRGETPVLAALDKA